MIRPQTCPICEQELASDAGLNSETFPFCSERCRQVDLFRWSEGKYAIVDPMKPEDLDPESLDPDSEDFPEELRDLLE